MAVLCAKCGEELLGAINRCWRCGTEYESRSGKIDVPPLRRAPIASDRLGGALEALLVDDNLAVENTDVDSGSQDGADSTIAHVPEIRRGSPFRPQESPEVQANAESMLGAPPRAARYPKNNAASAGSTIAITLGLLGLGLGYYIPLAGLITAGVGLGLGVWGLYSRRRSAAIFGLLLCCAAITISGFFGAAEVYRAIHGVAPWE